MTFCCGFVFSLVSAQSEIDEGSVRTIRISKRSIETVQSPEATEELKKLVHDDGGNQDALILGLTYICRFSCDFD